MADANGVFLSRVDSDEFEPDDEDGGFAHWVFSEGGSSAGMWKPDPAVSKYEIELSARELVVVLEGSVRIEIEGAPTLDLRAGDIAALPKGARTTWEPSHDFREVWAFFSEDVSE